MPTINLTRNLSVFGRLGVLFTGKLTINNQGFVVVPAVPAASSAIPVSSAASGHVFFDAESGVRIDTRISAGSAVSAV